MAIIIFTRNHLIVTLDIIIMMLIFQRIRIKKSMLILSQIMKNLMIILSQMMKNLMIILSQKMKNLMLIMIIHTKILVKYRQNLMKIL
jgi:hypothetical protein